MNVQSSRLWIIATWFFAFAASPSLTLAGPSADDIIDWYKNEGLSGHIIVAKGKQIVIDRQVGKASWADDIDFAPDAPFYIGSVTKQITAAAILKLQERGSLSVGDKLSRYFPTAPHAEEVTLHQLLTHTSGLKNYTDLPEISDRIDTGAPITTDEILALVAPYPLDFSPGEKWSYSNTGYVLLGMIVEKISGLSINDFWQTEFFANLGMTGAAYTPGQSPNNEPAGHQWDRDYQLVPAQHGHMSWAHAAGGVYASVYDMLKWSEALHNDGLLSTDSYAAMINPVMNDYGYGVSITEVNGKKVIGHGGGLPGFTCQILALPAEDIHVIVLTNLSGANSMAASSSIKLMQHFAGGDVQLDPPLNEQPLTEDQMAAYTGTYKIESVDLGATVYVDNGRIYFEPDQQEAARMLFLGDDLFALRIDGIRIRFKRDETGRVTEFTLTQRGRDFVGIRQ